MGCLRSTCSSRVLDPSLGKANRSKPTGRKLPDYSYVAVAKGHNGVYYIDANPRTAEPAGRS